MVFLNLEAPIHQLMTWTWAHPCQAPHCIPPLPGMGSLMSLSVQGTAWLLPHPRQSHSSSLRYPGLSQLLSRRETPPNSPYVPCTKGTGSGSSMAPHSVELCQGLTTILLCSKHQAVTQAAPSGSCRGKRAGHSQLMISPNPPLASRMKEQSHKSPWRLQLTLSHTFLLAKIGLSTSSEPWALILAASAQGDC